MICIVVPTIRDISEFKEQWKSQIKKHTASLIIVDDRGDVPIIHYNNNTYSIENIIPLKFRNIIYNHSDCVRNLGFYFAKKRGADYILSLDDDVRPVGDTIGDHKKVLGKKFPISWFNPSMTNYLRGFPYKMKKEAECWISHGVADGCPDLDAKTQKKIGIKPQEYYRGPIPRGSLFPFSAMNFMFSVKALPFVYQAPMIGPIQRYADIFGGIECKRDLDALNKCIVSGFSRVYHHRKSNVNDNFKKEKTGMKMNENYGAGEYFNLFMKARQQWKTLCSLKNFSCTFDKFVTNYNKP